MPAERELVERFSVSRPTIREAVIALEAQGYVAVKTGSGVYVLERQAEIAVLGQSVSPFEVIESRVYIEGEAAALAAAMITPEQLAELDQALQEMAQENQTSCNLISAHIRGSCLLQFERLDSLCP